MANRGLGEEEIEEFLYDYAESEDGFDGDDDSIADPDFIPDLEVPMEVENLEEVDGVDIDTIIENIENFSGTSQLSAPSETLPQPGPSSGPVTSGRSQPRQKLNLRWRKKNLELNEQQLCFTGGEDLSAEFLELDSPVQFFFKLFPKDLFAEIARQTNLYIVMKDTNMSFRVTETDIQQFIGLVYIMSLVNLPRVTKHWSSGLGTSQVKDTMPVNKFEKIRRFIHFNDNSNMAPRDHADHDRLFKIRPILMKLNENCLNVPFEKYLCVDEQICSTKARNNLKRYNE